MPTRSVHGCIYSVFPSRRHPGRSPDDETLGAGRRWRYPPFDVFQRVALMPVRPAGGPCFFNDADYAAFFQTRFDTLSRL